MSNRTRQTKPDSLAICIWNADGLSRKKDELEIFAKDNGLDVILVSETHLTSKPDPKLFGYELYRCDRPNSHWGGVAIYIKSNISHHLTGTPTLTTIEACSVQVDTKNGPLCLSALYKRPSMRLDPADVTALLNRRGQVILGGDLNCKHRSWNSKNQNRDGKTLRQTFTRLVEERLTCPSLPCSPE